MSTPFDVADALDEAAMFNPVGVGLPVGYECDEAQWCPKTRSWIHWTPDPPDVALPAAVRQLELPFGETS